MKLRRTMIERHLPPSFSPEKNLIFAPTRFDDVTPMKAHKKSGKGIEMKRRLSRENWEGIDVNASMNDSC